MMVQYIGKIISFFPLDLSMESNNNYYIILNEMKEGENNIE